MAEELGDVEAVLSGDRTLYQSDVSQELLEEPRSYRECVQEYVEDAKAYAQDLWEDLEDRYVEHELSGLDRAQEALAETVVEYSPDLENEYAQAVADSAVEFGRSFGQAVAGSIMAPSALYDAVQEWKDTGECPISPYVQMEEHRDGDCSLAETSGKAAGFLTGATLVVHYPFVLLAGAAQTGRHIAERKLHHYLQERLDEDAPEDGDVLEQFRALYDVMDRQEEDVTVPNTDTDPEPVEERQELHDPFEASGLQDVVADAAEDGFKEYLEEADTEQYEPPLTIVNHEIGRTVKRPQMQPVTPVSPFTRQSRGTGYGVA